MGTAKFLKDNNQFEYNKPTEVTLKDVKKPFYAAPEQFVSNNKASVKIDSW
jgi:hypothetical protein